MYENTSEVNSINKQKFLAELSKLLTFMYEEDRQEALAAYSRMFEEADDEQKLLQILVSPTRQAVIVARAYDAKERKLQVTTQVREEGLSAEKADETPAFLAAIDKVRSEAVEKDVLRANVSEDQFSLFAQPAEAEQVPEQEELPLEEPVETEVTESVPEEPAEEEPVPAEPVPEEPAVEEEQPPAEPEEPAPEDNPAEEEFMPELPEQEQPAPQLFVSEEPDEPKKEAMVGWLTLFMIFAIPIGLVACALMIVFALLFLGLAAAVAVSGVFALRSIFLGFAVFADILVVGGAAIALLALALLFLWTAIWFLAGAIPGIIRGLAELARNWCYKEVAE